MVEKTAKILAVNPGSRYVGLAVFYGSDLRDWKVRSLVRLSPDEKCDAFAGLISELLERHNIEGMVMKALHPARSSNALRSLIQHVKRICRARKLRLVELSVEDVKRCLLPDEKGNKRRLMEEMAARYPFLYPELEREKNNSHPYLIRSFEAVALGVAYLNDNRFASEKVERRNIV